MEAVRSSYTSVKFLPDYTVLIPEDDLFTIKFRKFFPSVTKLKM
jgi:hypothetical protein